MKYVLGDLIKMADAGDFDIIAQGCNCFNTMRRAELQPVSGNVRHKHMPLIVPLTKVTGKSLVVIPVRLLKICIQRVII